MLEGPKFDSSFEGPPFIFPPFYGPVCIFVPPLDGPVFIFDPPVEGPVFIFKTREGASSVGLCFSSTHFIQIGKSILQKPSIF